MADWPAGVTARVIATTDTTMAEAARAAATMRGPEWVLALEQTAAKGRRGRPWVMPPGNFAASLIFRPDAAPAQAALRSFVAALALDQALSRATGFADALTLKWPNDVLLNGGKVAGILLESLGAGGRVDHLIIGFGVNLVAAPDPAMLEAGAVPPVSVLSETGVTLTPEDFLPHLATAFAGWEAQFVTYGFAPIRTAWLARAARLGQPITARTPRDAITGIFRDVDETGNLVLDTPQGRRAIAAADVFF
jgi:BirA family biotin operon repressor/biotin-[acetyl-CoA-carboxylase] ligase